MSFLHVIKSTSYNTDGRLLKWLDSLNDFEEKSIVYIIEDRNQQIREGNIYKDRLFSRIFFKKRNGYAFKVVEYLFRFCSVLFSKSTNEVKVIVFHDVQQYLNLYFSLIFRFVHKKKIIWDLHELPHQYFEKYSLLRGFIRLLISKSDLIVFTNDERKEYVSELYGICDFNFFVLNNYPSEDYSFQNKNELDDDIKLWLNSKPYILWLGAAAEGRNFNTFLTTYMDNKDKYKLIILGKVDDKFKDIINNLKKEGYVLTNFVPQTDMIKYIDNAYFSVVLYNKNSPNNWLCEPNRLYQLMARNVPIICGNNPTMKAVVQTNGGGIVLQDDGSSQQSMYAAFREMEDNYSLYKNNKKANKESMLWEPQFDEMHKKLLKL